jgi:hypothetical protein
MAGSGRLLIIFGVLLVIVGGALLLLAGPAGSRAPWLGRLPGDIHVERGAWSFHFPLVTCLLLSVVLTLVLNVFFRR